MGSLYNQTGDFNLLEVDKRLDSDVTRDIIKEINAKGYLTEDEFHARLIDTGKVMQMGRYKVVDYLKAVEFTSYKLEGDSQVESYRKTFPDRCQGKTNGAILGKSSLYGQGDLVVKLLGMAQVPLKLLYMRERHLAVRKLAELVETGETERIQMESADKLLNHLPDTEELQINFDMGEGTQSVITDFNDSLNRIADMAHKRLTSGKIDARTLIQSQRVVNEQ